MSASQPDQDRPATSGDGAAGARSSASHDSLAGLPDYAGSADPGLRDSLPAGDAALGDVVDLVGAEHGKLESLLATMVALRDTDQQQQLDDRWYGVVRELLEYGTALERVVWPALDEAEAADPELGQQHAAQRALLERLRAQDEMLDRSADPDLVVDLATASVRTLRDAERVLVPALQRLPEDERQRLGEDVRQVMG